MKAVAIGLLLTGALLADFRYDATTRITKGMATKFGKKPEADTTTNYFKGDRMATVSKDNKSIIDFGKETFTVIDLSKRQYWQVTFAEMQQMMADMNAEMKEATKGKDVNVNMKFDAKATGVQKEVGGFPAKQVIFTIEAAASDGKNNAGMMRIVNDSWHSENVPGYSEYRAFQERMKDKANWMGMRNPMASAGQPGMAEGMQRMIEEMQKTPGIPVLTISRITMPGMNLNFGGGGAGGENVDLGGAAKEAAGSTAGSTAGRQVGGSMGGLVGGALGGKLGGFGRKKKDNAPSQAEAEAAARDAKKAIEESQTGEGMLVSESFTDASNFSTASIGDDVFAAPADFKKVEPEMVKRKRR